MWLVDSTGIAAAERRKERRKGRKGEEEEDGDGAQKNKQQEQWQQTRCSFMLCCKHDAVQVKQFAKPLQCAGRPVVGERRGRDREEEIWGVVLGGGGAGGC